MPSESAVSPGGTSTAHDPADLQRRLAEAERENAALRATLDDQTAHLDGLVARLETLTERERELRALLVEAHDQLFRRDEEIDRRAKELEKLRARDQTLTRDLARTREELQSERKRLKAFRQSRYWRARMWLKRLLRR